MSITAAQVKELRERTGAGMMECKKALIAAQGDIETAIEAMRKSGQTKAAKKAGRIAAEGVIAIQTAADNKTAFMVEINTETDFAARDESFKEFVAKVTAFGLEIKAKDIATLLAAKIEDDITVSQACENLIAKIGENIQVRRAVLMESDGIIGSYSHNNRIGVMVDLSIANITLAKDIAMHIAASKPEVITPENVSDAAIAKEKEIYMVQAQQSGKPAEIIKKMIKGRVNKFVNEISLVGQPFVKDPTISVGELLKKENAAVKSFIRYEVGEGIEKEETDFATEVIKQAGM